MLERGERGLRGNYSCSLLTASIALSIFHTFAAALCCCASTSGRSLMILCSVSSVTSASLLPIFTKMSSVI
ncbi:hypothetical protein B484DRAFT_455822 [Ochromonadaceae sp. CCMP2298]|nr:hypothetical protein B484DRAFT_455822 [Ochromonadaceae sp. CCMP2298]